jgi:ketosteroid isomerase-like protein
MGQLPAHAARDIEQIHAKWIAFEVAGENHRLIELCADDIELRPPDREPVLGVAAVSAQLADGDSRIHNIEITDLRVRGSNEIAYLTANYKTQFSLPEDASPRQAVGSHVWILRKKHHEWLVALVAWSAWGHAASNETSH